MSVHARSVDVVRHRAGDVDVVSDQVAIEEPLEIRVQGPLGGPSGEPVRVAVTMRTPGHDQELAAGFLRTEGLVEWREDFALEAGPIKLTVVDAGQIVTLRLAHAFDASRLARNFYATSSCGVCGKAALEYIDTHAGQLAAGPTVSASVLKSLPRALSRAQETFEITGGLHATGLYDASGQLLVAREDVGRHNAMDKVIGRAFLDGLLPLSNHLMMVSGRASFELVQKAAMAGVTILCAVSAPSSLAVALADKVGMTLVGFLRDERFNVYCHAERIAG